VNIGSDKVCLEQQRLVIHAAEAMDLLLMLLLGADSTLRFGQSLKLDVERSWGFCEWLWPGRRIPSR
jgi:hypothetical protein